jgi:hypothetical protein
LGYRELRELLCFLQFSPDVLVRNPSKSSRPS